ncbi:MAG: YbaB/EbfC family nucleoid-associated protein [Gammaproteobacteria bacterium]|nr:YbaB/EbfC family nucleoid-associated protein [Gammaproteobacteria bacterium]
MMQGGLGNLMKKAQQMQEDMKKAQEELKNLEVEGQSGGGLVKIVMTGKHEVRKVHIEESLLNEDKDMLEDLIAAALNDASNKVDKSTKDQFSSLTDGLNLPGGMKLPF